MRFFSISMIAGFVVLSLSGCFGPQYRTVHEFSPPESPQGRMCVNKCLDSKTYCERTGQQVRIQQKQMCLQEEKIQAEMRYEDYLHVMEHKGEVAEKSYYDFYRKYNCNHINEGSHDPTCEANYRACYQNCGGQVQSHTYCVSNCDEKPQGN
ncbi:MAG: hypothetical protein KAI89_02430 [Emcibacter sp.]|nr:hypothetical protein [Emcibacter sp.]